MPLGKIGPQPRQGNSNQTGPLAYTGVQAAPMITNSENTIALTFGKGVLSINQTGTTYGSIYGGAGLTVSGASDRNIILSGGVDSNGSATLRTLTASAVKDSVYIIPSQNSNRTAYTQSVVVGGVASAGGSGNAILGYSASTGGANCVAIGNLATTGGASCVAIGSSSNAAAAGAIAIGLSAVANNADDTIIGRGASSSGGSTSAVILGAYSTVTTSALNTTVLGFNSSSAITSGITIGSNTAGPAVATGLIAIGRGAGNNSTQIYSTVLQGGVARSQFATAVGTSGYGIYASFTGSYQWEEMILYAGTTNATLTEMFADFTTASNRLVLPNNSMWTFTIMLQARRTDVRGDAMAWKIEGSILRNANAAATSFVGTPVITTLSNSGTLAWSPTITADTTNGALAMRVTGEAAKTIKWFARISTVELNGV